MALWIINIATANPIMASGELNWSKEPVIPIITPTPAIT
jgi:hypothetical protein